MDSYETANIPIKHLTATHHEIILHDVGFIGVSTDAAQARNRFVHSYITRLFLLVQWSISGLYTLFLFSKSDVVLVICPTLTVALTCPKVPELSTFLQAFVWMVLHLLAFNIQNQLFGVEEDKVSKPDRPFASGRISIAAGRRLHAAVVFVSVWYSVRHRLTWLSFVYACVSTAYNEFGLAANPFLKNTMSAVGYLCYGWGVAHIVGKQQPLSPTTTYAILSSLCIFSFTGHASDFKDRSGDALMGRRTIPLILPARAARGLLALAMAGSTYGLILLWSPPMLVGAAFVVLCFVTSFEFMTKHSEKDDRKSFVWYEFWLLFAHLLPVFKREMVWSLGSTQ